MTGKAANRPTLLEAAIGLAVMLLVGFGGAIALARAGWTSERIGLILTAWSALAGGAGFGAAWLFRRRPPRDYGLGPISSRWLIFGIVAGMLAFLAKGLVVLLVTSATGASDNPQSIYAAGAAGSAISLIVATLCLGLLTPIGEELLFRGIITSALLRFGSWAGVVGGAVIFALAHGVNIILPVALLLGCVAGELFRRSGSLWPGVAAHMIYNLPTIPLMVWSQAG